MDDAPIGRPDNPLVGLRILAFADRAPRTDPAAIVAAERPDLIVFLGDLEPGPFLGLAGIGVPMAGVYGNHDGAPWLRRIGASEVDRDGMVQDIGGRAIRIIGRSGCRRYKSAGFGPDHQWSDAEDEAWWDGVSHADLVLSHAPPAGISDRIEQVSPPRAATAADLERQIEEISIDNDDPAHIGSLAGRRWLATAGPHAWLHGHTYPAENTWSRLVGRTEVHYAYGHRLITIGHVGSVLPDQLPAARPATGRAPRSMDRFRFLDPVARLFGLRGGH